MPGIGARCHEMRTVDEGATWRIVYRLADDVVVVDVFSKKTRQTPGRVIVDCRRRLRQYDELARQTIESGANMDKRKRAKLRAARWTVGTPREFLKLPDEEAAYVEFKLALSKTLRALRAAQELSQVDVAKRLHSSQSRVAKMEASDSSVSVDLLVKSLFRLGAQPADIAKALRPLRRVAAT